MNEPTPDFPAPANESAPPKLRNVKLEGEDKALALAMQSEVVEVKRLHDEARARFDAEIARIQENWAEQVKDFWSRMGQKFNFDGDSAAMNGSWILDTSLHADLDLVLIRETVRAPKPARVAQVGRKLN